MNNIFDTAYDLMENEMPNKPYHNIEHVDSLIEEIEYLDIPDTDKELLRIAAIFHDIGHRNGPENHEQRSATVARNFLESEDINEEIIDTITQMILDTKLFKEPESRLGAILSDVDTHSFAYNWDQFKKTSLNVKQEEDPTATRTEWWNSAYNLLNEHEYHSDIGKNRYNQGKEKTIEQLQKRI